MAVLTGLIDRVEALLMDSGNLVWDTATLTEAVRLAVGEYGLAGQLPVTVSGLDGAAVTTLPEVHDSLVVIGAAGYAAVARAADRAESFQLGSESSALKGWGEARFAEFRGMLRFAFPAYAGAAVSGGETGEDAALLEARISLLAAQAALAGAQAGLAEAQASEVSTRAGKVAEEEALLAAQAQLVTAQAAEAGARKSLLEAQAAAEQAQALRVSAQEALATAQAGRVADEKTLLSARAALLNAQAAEASARAAALGETGAAEADRLRDLRESEHRAWGTWG